jgi:hypothetical protein
VGEKFYVGIVKANDVHPDETLPRFVAPVDRRVRVEDWKVRDLERLLKGMETDNSEEMVPLARNEIYDQ